MEKALKLFEKVVVVALLCMMGIIILISTVELAIMLFNYLINYSQNIGEGNYVLLDSGELLRAFSFVMLILIGVELFETIKFYLDRNVFQAEVILLVALTAIARKIIVLEFGKYDGMTLIAIGIVIFALSAGYFLIKKAHHIEEQTKKSISDTDSVKETTEVEAE